MFRKNFAYTTVGTAPSPASSGTSLVVADGTVFPAVPFNATIWPTAAQPLSSNAEIVTVTNIATNTLTITRAQESTSARTVLVGDQIAQTVTTGLLDDLVGWTVTEVDFGTTPVWDATFTVTDANVSATSDVTVAISGKVATGRVGNDHAWDGLICAALPAAGSFELTVLAIPGPVVGKRKLQYQIG
jgi:hypothetical protein